MPVLGICRGMQALNAVMGGGLARHIPEHDSTDEEGEEKSSYHRIYIAPGSKLAAVVGARRVRPSQQPPSAERNGGAEVASLAGGGLLD